MDASERIIDANANRAREACRVLEDSVRFALADAALARGLKDLRHDLRAALDSAGLTAASLAAWRDTPGDVGTAHTTESERGRGSTRDVAIAAGKRLGEALRALEEFMKVGSPGGANAAAAAATVKALRYRAYELERRVLAAFGAGRGTQHRLCVLLTESLCIRHPWLEVAQRAIAGGADCLQLREKSLPDRELLARARRLVELARSAATPTTVYINDRPDIALLSGADGVHLGQTDLPLPEVRRLLGDRLLIGVSTSCLAEALAAAAEGADVCGIGPMFTTTTKDKPTLAGPEYLRAYLGEPRTARIPHLAISGITPANIGALVESGCRGVAVSSFVCGSADPAAACRGLLAALGAGRSSADQGNGTGGPSGR